ncbi:hypothetical protein Tco_1538785 [Tanacetum coccineum]
MKLRPFDMYSVKPGGDVNLNRSVHNIRAYTSEEVHILVSKLVFTFSRELWTSSRNPSNFDDRYTDILEFFDLAVHDSTGSLTKLSLSSTRISSRVIMEYFVKISKKARILELKRRNLKNIIPTFNSPYPSRKIRRICTCTSQETTKNKVQYAVSRRLLYACMTRSSTKELFTPFENPKREFRSSRKLFKTPEFDLFSDQEENSEEEVAETMAETMEEYMYKTRSDYGSGVDRPKIDDKYHFELKGQFLKELRDNTFSGSDHEDTNKHIKRILETVDLFHIPNITQESNYASSFPYVPHWIHESLAKEQTIWFN